MLARPLPGVSALLMAMHNHQTPKTTVLWNCKARLKVNDIFTTHVVVSINGEPQMDGLQWKMPARSG